jgi:hypothetical protein
MKALAPCCFRKDKQARTMDILFLTFGPNIRNHYQANFCILSLLKAQNQFAAINVLTDHSEFYRHLGDRVKIVPITAAQVQEWKGEYNFVFRPKIKALEHFISQHGERPILFLDSDTFLYRNDTDFKKLLEQNIAFMHEPEGKVSEMSSKTAQKMWNGIQGKTFGGITISKDHVMWNSGVIGIPSGRNLEAVQLALQICDEMLRAGVTSFMTEQFSLSLALEKIYGLRPATPWIGHYWSNKEDWNEVISAFFLESLLTSCTHEQEIKRIERFNFAQLPVKKKVKNTRLRLIKLVDKIFPIKPITYTER